MSSSSVPRSSAATAPAVFAGTRLVYASILVFGAMCGAGWLVAGGGEEGLRAPIRATARTTALLFVVLFCTSAVRRRWPGAATNWLMRNRRYLGLSAAVSHGYHLIFILALYGIGKGGDTDILTVIGGGWGFVLLGLMAATSNDASQRGLRKNWRRLHLLGMWTVWIIYAVSYFPRVSDPIAVIASLLLLVSLGLRVWPKPQARAATT